MNLLDPTTFKSEFSKLHTSHADLLSQVADNRKLRQNLVDVEAMKKTGALQPGQTYVAVRTIDGNVSRGVPPYLQYIKGSRRMGIFEPINKPGFSTEPLELAVTNLLQYTGWEIDYIRWIDGGLLHGADYVEVVHDKTKPGRVAVNHIGSDSLLYSRKGESIQQSPIVARLHSISSVDLDSYVSSSTFTNQTAVEQLRQHIIANESPSTGGAFVEIHKCLFKVNGIVHFCWYSKDIQEMLSEPAPFFNGRCTKQVTQVLQPGTMQIVEQASYPDIPETDYPYVMFSPSITEEKKIEAQLGHAQKDRYIQEAQSVLQTAGVNGCYAASMTQWAPEESKDYTSSGVGKRVNMQLLPGQVWDKPMKAWAPPYPDATLFRALDHLDTGNATANNQIAWAVNNRQDSRKTATEVQSANQATSQINSVQVLYLSIPMRQVVERAYHIIKSQVLKGALVLQIDPALFELEYIIKSAGDIDYVQRQERIAAMQQDWPVIQNTPAAPVFLADYLRERYPATAERYIQAMQQTNDVALITQLAQMLQQAVTDETGNLRPEWQQFAGQLQQIATQVQQRVAGGMGSAAGNPSSPQPSAAGTGGPYAAV